MGKIERLHRTMKAELLQGRRFLDFAAAQTGLDRWRHHYITSGRTKPSTGPSRRAAIE